MPVSAFFTLVTSRAWSAMLEVLVDDADAALARHAIAVRASVTVSIADDTIGMPSRMPGGQLRRDVDVRGNDVAFGRDQQDVVERQRFSKMTVGQHLGTLADQAAGRLARLKRTERR